MSKSDSTSKEFRENLKALKQKQLNEEWEKRKQEAVQKAAAEHAGDDQVYNRRTGKYTTHFDLMTQVAEEELDDTMKGYTSAQTALFALVQMAKHISEAGHHGLKGWVKSFFAKHGEKIEILRDYPKVTNQVSCDDNGKLNIPNLKLEGISNEVLNDPKSIKNISQMNKAHMDFVRKWLGEEWECVQIQPAQWRNTEGKVISQDEYEDMKDDDKKWQCTQIHAGTWEDKDGIALSSDALERMKQHDTKGLDAFMKRVQPDVKIEHAKPEVKDDKDAEEAPPHRPRS